MRDKDSVISEQNRLIEALEEKLSGRSCGRWSDG